MQASIIDLRYHMKDVLAAIKRNERVHVIYYKKEIAVITPTQNRKKISVKDHPFYGLLAKDTKTVQEKMDQLRNGRYRDL